MNFGHKGFTLIELMVTLGIAAILTAIAVPSYREIIRNNRLTTYANELITSLNLARSEAVKRGGRVTVRILDANSLTNTGAAFWESGWDIFTDADGNGNFDPPGDTLIKTNAGMEPGYTARSDNFIQYIQFDALGMSNTSGGFVICDNSDTNLLPDPNTARLIDIRTSGKISLMEDTDNPKDGIPNKNSSTGTNISTCVDPSG